MTVVDWLLDSDPALRWQVLQGLTDAPPEAVAVGKTKHTHQRHTRKYAEGQLGEATEHEPVAVSPVQLAAVNGKLKIREAAEQRAEGDPRLEPSEGCT